MLKELNYEKSQFNLDKMICQLDQRTCDPINQVADELKKFFIHDVNSINRAIKEFASDLPCAYCVKVIKKQVGTLHNVRLGKHERRILLTAPSPEGEPEIIEPPEGGIRINESHLKAIRKLNRIGLLWRKRKKQRRLAVCLSPLGQAIVKLLETELHKRSPIRWVKYRVELIKVAPLTGEDLVEQFENRIKYSKLLEQIRLSDPAQILLQAVPDMLYRLDKNGNFIDFQPDKESKDLLSSNEVLGRNIADIFPEYVAKQIQHRIEIVLSTGKPQMHNYQLEIKGQKFIYQSKMVASGNNDVLSIARDVTAEKSKELEIKNLYDTYLTVLDNIDAIVYVADMQTYEVLYANKYTENRVGDILGKPCWQVLQAEQSDICTDDKLLDSKGNPNKNGYAWKFQNSATDKWFDIRDRAIEWVDGRIVRLEIAIPAENVS